jgi:hypothetical protein
MRLVLEAMESEVKKGIEWLVKMQESIDLLFSKMESQDVMQTQMVAQMELIAKAVTQTCKD